MLYVSITSEHEVRTVRGLADEVKPTSEHSYYSRRCESEAVVESAVVGPCVVLCLRWYGCICNCRFLYRRSQGADVKGFVFIMAV